MKSCLSNTGDIWKFIMIVVSESTVEALSLTMLLSLTNMVWEHQCWMNSGKAVLQIFNSPSSCSSAQVLSLISRHNLMSVCFDGLNCGLKRQFRKMPFVEFLLNIKGNIEVRLPFTHDNKAIATCFAFWCVIFKCSHFAVLLWLQHIISSHCCHTSVDYVLFAMTTIVKYLG